MSWWIVWLKRRGVSVEHSELDARAPFFAVCVYVAALVLLKMLMWCFVFSGGFVRLPSQERKETQNARPQQDPTECFQKKHNLLSLKQTTTKPQQPAPKKRSAKWVDLRGEAVEATTWKGKGKTKCNPLNYKDISNYIWYHYFNFRSVYSIH